MLCVYHQTFLLNTGDLIKKEQRKIGSILHVADENMD